MADVYERTTLQELIEKELQLSTSYVHEYFGLKTRGLRAASPSSIVNGTQ